MIIDELKTLFAHIEEVHEEATALGVHLKNQLDEMTPGELADAGFMLRNCERYFDDARKEVKSRKELISKLLCVQLTRRALEGGELIARGKLASASPDTHVRPKIPKYGTPEYIRLLTWLGIPADAIEGGALNIHFNRMSERLTRLASEGKQLPEGLLPTYTESTCTFRGKR